MGKSALEPKMIEQAEGAGASITSGRLTIVLDDALHYLAALPQHSLDIVASGYVFHNLTGWRPVRRVGSAIARPLRCPAQ